MRDRVLSTLTMRGGSQRYWPLVSILLVLSIFGHHVVMAGITHADDTFTQESAVQLQPAVAPDYEASSSAPHNPCDPDGQISLVSTPSRPITWTTSGICEAAFRLDVDHQPVVDATTPPLTSAERRTLLQVFLI